MSIPLKVWLRVMGTPRDIPENTFTATELMAPVRQTVLLRRSTKRVSRFDYTKTFATALGSAIHSSIELAWKDEKYKEALVEIGIPRNQLDNVNVVQELRTTKPVGEFFVSGQFDMVMNGQLYDFKTSTVTGYQMGGSIQNHILQGSIYRWLNPELITEDTVKIGYILKDWNKSRNTYGDYPDSPIQEGTYPLMSFKETDQWIKERVGLIAENLERYPDVIRCPEEELWKSEDKYRYFSKQGLKRATKVFKKEKDALDYLEHAGTGYLVKEDGLPKRCNWCPVFEECTQKNEYFN